MIFFYIFIIGLPAFLILLTIKRIIKVRTIEKEGLQTNAVITHIVLLRSSKSSSDRITLEYKDNRGNTYPGKITTVTGKYNRSDIIPLKYLSEKPSHYTVKGMQQGQWGILIFCVLLLAFTIFASFKISELTEGTNFHFSP